MVSCTRWMISIIEIEMYGTPVCSTFQFLCESTELENANIVLYKIDQNLVLNIHICYISIS